MHLQRGKIFKNFNDSKTIRVVDWTADVVVCALLQRPGGWIEIERKKFMTDFTDTPVLAKTEPERHQKPKTDPKYKDQSHNWTAREFAGIQRSSDKE